MLSKLKELIKYRQLIITLVSRELKARYRGTVLGFLWSFFNPLLLMLVYSMVFVIILPQGSGKVEGIDIKGVKYSMFLFSGLLPWIWFATSVLESSSVLISNGNLIKKIRFPLEVLPIMTVITNMIHFLLGLPVMILFFIIFKVPLTSWLLFLPVAILVQFIFVMGLSFLLSSLTVHFRDLRDIVVNLITLWFFSTPILYPFAMASIQNNPWLKTLLSLNPMTHIIEAYQYTFFFGSLPHYKRLSVTMIVGLLFFYLGYYIFDKLRDTYVEEV